jgi:hypothetical protein
LTITTGLTSLTKMSYNKNLFVAAAALLLIVVPAFSAGAQEAVERTGATSHTVEPAPGRFDGYLFLDADGHPLPFQSDEQIEQFLSTATVVSMKKIPVGVSDPRKMLIAGQGVRLHAVYKDIDHEEQNFRDTTAGKSKMYLMWRDWYGYDIAAYHVDRLLGNDRVPPVIERSVKRNNGSVQIWLEGVITENERREKGFDPPNIARFNQQREIMHIFDNLVANRDSNLGNALIDRNWRLWFIDCSRCFGTSEDLCSRRPSPTAKGACGRCCVSWTKPRPPGSWPPTCPKPRFEPSWCVVTSSWNTFRRSSTSGARGPSSLTSVRRRKSLPGGAIRC